MTPPATTPLDPIEQRFWIPVISLSLEAAWYGMNAQGRFTCRARKRRWHHPWQSRPGGDLADELGSTTDEQARHFATTA